jgi:hypothetical protein
MDSVRPSLQEACACVAELSDATVSNRPDPTPPALDQRCVRSARRSSGCSRQGAVPIGAGLREGDADARTVRWALGSSGALLHCF